MRRRTFIRGAAASICAPAVLQAGGFSDSELVFCLDWSKSMYSNGGNSVAAHDPHYLIQRDSHVRAFLSSSVMSLLLKNQPYVHVILWAEELFEVLTLFSGAIRSRGDVEALANTVRFGVPDVAAGNNLTNHYVPLQYVREQLPQMGARRIVDITTDQSPSTPFKQKKSVAERDALYGSGHTINVLAIDPLREHEWKLKQYVKTENGFVLRVENWEGYAHALKKKMERELLMF